MRKFHKGYIPIKKIRSKLCEICYTVPPRSCGTRGCPLYNTCRKFGFRVPDSLPSEEILQFYLMCLSEEGE